MIGRQYPKLSGNSLKLRIGLAVFLLAGGATSLLFGWGWIAGAVGVVAGVAAAVKTPA